MSESESESWKRIARVYANANKNLRTNVNNTTRLWLWANDDLSSDPAVKQLIGDLLELIIANYDIEDSAIGTGEIRREIYE
tara:strand:- start:1034 stop:1276 length:243 start_codon:yes stop_codon:yes gene_type:complete